MSEPPLLCPEVAPIRRSWSPLIYVFVGFFATGLLVGVSGERRMHQCSFPVRVPTCAVTELRATISASIARMWLEAGGIRDLGAHFVPAIDDGRVVGFKIYAIQPGSPLAMIGLMSGDTVTAINGQTLDSADSVLAAGARLRTGSFKLDVRRRGCPVTLRVSVL